VKMEDSQIFEFEPPSILYAKSQDFVSAAKQGQKK
jgi:hypothetical protein